MNSAPILPARLDWPSAIGLFILNFGTLEFLTLTFLESRQTPKQFEKTKEKSFQERIGVIEKEVLTGRFSAATRNDFQQFIVQLEPIRSLRNHLAHGYILGRWDEATANIVITLSKPREMDVAYSSQSLHVEFRTLVKALDQLKELIESFQRFLMMSAGPESPRP
jgi:hypothetical protein